MIGSEQRISASTMAVSRAFAAAASVNWARGTDCLSWQTSCRADVVLHLGVDQLGIELKKLGRDFLVLGLEIRAAQVVKHLLNRIESLGQGGCRIGSFDFDPGRPNGTWAARGSSRRMPAPEKTPAVREAESPRPRSFGRLVKRDEAPNFCVARLKTSAMDCGGSETRSSREPDEREAVGLVNVAAVGRWRLGRDGTAVRFDSPRS